MLSEWLNYQAQLRNYIHKHIDDADAVDDILQDVYIKASTRFGQLKSQDSLKSWLYRITHNVIMDFYRNRQPYEVLTDDIVVDEMSQEEANLQQMAQCIRPMFDCLPEKYRQPMLLAEIEGLSQQAIADQLGLSLSGAKSRVQRGRVKLKELLVSHCEIEVGREGIIDFKPKSQCQHLVALCG